MTSMMTTRRARPKSSLHQVDDDKTTKNQDGKYKTKESTGLDKSNAELTSDEEMFVVELSAVAEYLKKIEDECIVKPATYEDRKARREAEIAGLEEAWRRA